MIDERSASWKVLLPCSPQAKVLALGLDLAQLVSLARSWSCIDHDVDTGKEIHQKNVLRLLRRSNYGSHKELLATGEIYDIIVLGESKEIDLLNLKQLFLSNLPENGVMLCVGSKRCKQMRVQLYKSGARVEEYGLLPRETPRIIIPLTDRVIRKKGLTFHRPGSLSSRFSVAAASFLSDLGSLRQFRKNLVSLVYKNKSEGGATLLNWLEDRLGKQFLDLVIYCGSDAQQRKITALATTQYMEDFVVKIADTMLGKKAVNLETQALRAVADSLGGDAHIPEVVTEGEWAGSLIQVQTSLPKRGVRQIQQLKRIHLRVLKVLTHIDRRTVTFSKTSCCKDIKRMSSQAGSDTPEVIRSAIRTLLSPDVQDMTVTCHRIHGDFAPWNMNVGAREISIWDWEDSVEDGLLYTDIFHFIFRHAVLVGPWPGAQTVLLKISSACQVFQELAKVSKTISYIEYFKIWLTWEYFRNPHPHTIEVFDLLNS